MSKMINKKSMTIVSIIILLCIIFTSFTNIAMAGFNYQGTQINSINDLGILARTNPSKFMSIPASFLRGQLLELEEGNHQSDVLCVEHGVGSGVGELKRIFKVVDINVDGPNTARINGNSRSLSYDEKVYFNALAEATQKSTAAGASIAYGTGRDGAPWKTVIDYLCNTSPLESILGLSGGVVSGASWMLDEDGGRVRVNYDTAVERGRKTANSVLGKVSETGNPDEMQTEFEGDNLYLGPFQYKYSEAGKKISFYNIEITGLDADGKTIYTKNIKNPSEKDLYKKTSNSFVAVKNGTIDQNSDFYVKADKEADDAVKIKVKITIAGPEYYKSRMVLVGALDGDDQTIAVYSVGGGAETKTDQFLNYEFENHRGNLEIFKSGVKAGQLVNAVENMGFRVYYYDNNQQKQYIKIQAKTQPTNGNYVGAVEIRKQDPTTNVNEATVVYTDSSGYAALLRIDSRYEYYIEEITDRIDYSYNVVEAIQELNGNETNVLNDGIVGPITVKKQGESPKTTVKIKDDIKRGNLEIEKVDLDTGKPLSNVEFKIRTQSGLWMIASGDNGEYSLKTYDDFNNNSKYYEDNFTEDESKATVFRTDSNGKIYISGVDKGTYIIKEIRNNHYGYYSYEEVILDEVTVDGKNVSIDKNETVVEVNGDDTVTITTNVNMKNEKQVGDLIINKKDKESDKALEIVEFNVQRYNEETNNYEYIVVSKNDYIAGENWQPESRVVGEFLIGSMKYTSNPSEATTFVTDGNGTIKLKEILIGKYKVNEISVGDAEDTRKNYGYTPYNDRTDIDSEYVYWIDSKGNEHLLKDEPIELNISRDKEYPEITIVIKNKMKYLNITGKVWEDMFDGKSGSYEIYGKDIYTQFDRLVEGITVRLKDKNGNELKKTTTGNNGEYEFKDVLIKDLNNYFVEFEYDGLTYTTVATLVGNDPTINSKAGEVVEQRKSLNRAFTEITNKDNISDRNHGYSRDNSGNITGTLTYVNNTENFESIYESTTYDNKTYTGTNLTANTEVPGYNLNEQYINKNYIIRADGSYEIQNVNLGIIKRSKPHIAISNDIENVKVDVNGYSHMYYYKQRGSAVEDGSAFNVAVKFGREYVSGYTRAIYPSDVAYSSTEAGKQDANKLKVYVTYATTIRNLSGDIKASVNELVNYYDKEYTIVDSWVGDDTNSKVAWNLTSKYGQSYNDGNFVGAYTTSIAGTKINPMQNLVVHITFQVSDNAVLGLLSETSTLDNTSEIYSYSSYYRDAKEGCATDEIYAGIDEVSAPGNAKPGERATYEADTDGAPSLLLEAKGVRTIEGNVFEDRTESELQSAKERKGDGIYSNDENTIGGVKVELLTSEGNVATIFPTVADENGNLVVNAKGDPIPAVIETTEKNGYYVFRGIEPNKYYIRYTYSNGITKVFDTSGNEVKDINVQDYKSTIITSETIRRAFEDNDNNLTWYKEKGTRYSDARDDYGQRQNIDNELKALDGASVISIKDLNAYSPTLELGVEYETIYTASVGDTYEYKVSDIDFGIVERPRQAITLDKDITNIMVKLYNGQSFGGEIDIKNKKAPEGMFITPDGVYITIDTEFIPGTHLAVKYALSLTNISEIDYISQDYYYYGDIKGDAVTFNRATLLDFIDKQLLLQQGQNQWQVIGAAEKFESDKGFEWTLNSAQEKELLKQFSSIAKADPVSTTNQLVPGATITTPITLEKIIDAKDTELNYGNNCEVAKIEKNGGSKYDYKLGNYANILIGDSEILPQEADEDKAPKVTIIPPTGENNSVTYTIIAVSSLAVLALGIFVIRKMLKK